MCIVYADVYVCIYVLALELLCKNRSKAKVYSTWYKYAEGSFVHC